MLSPRDILARAVVPEHSVPFMQAVSGGRVLVLDHFVFYTADDWLMAIAYPLLGGGSYSHARFEAALDEALRQSGATACFAAGPDLPPRLAASVLERDTFYTLPAAASVPPRLRSPVRTAQQRLHLEESRDFGPQHRRLWAEFLSRTALRANVRELYARTPQMLAAPGADVRLLNAWDRQGRLVACLVLDYSTPRFVSYVIGARSRQYAVPHAGDALFALMLEKAGAAGSEFVQLGLGVNAGITRFKRKWEAEPHLPYVMAQWQERPRSGVEGVVLHGLVHALTERSEDLSGRQTADRLPDQRPFAMLWELEREGRRSWLCGTAHFFCYSFADAFRRLFRQVDTVLFEGPLDEDSLARVEARGRQPEPGAAVLGSLMTEEEIRRLERVVCGVRGPVARFLNMEWEHMPDVRERLNGTRHWYAFFSLWTSFLERQGWRGSVDLEAWHLARGMGRTIVAMETLEEQLDSLEAVPVPRVLDFFRHCGQWRAYMRRNIVHYLRGELHAMMGTSTEFPTRTEQVIDVRDQRFRQRMLPFIRRGNVAVFVGAAHLLRLRGMLAEDGFTVRQVLPTWRLRLRARLRGTQDIWRPGPDGSVVPPPLQGE